MNDSCESPSSASSSSSSCPPMLTPTSSGSDEGIFEMDPTDMALSSIPGQDSFDPRRHRFSDDELKPQPMIKKARKMLVPEDLKVRVSTYFKISFKNDTDAFPVLKDSFIS